MAWTCESPSAASDACSSRPGRVAGSAPRRIALLAFCAFALVLASAGSGLPGWGSRGLGPQPAFAVTTGSVKAQISSLQAKFATAGAAVHQATVAYQQAVATEQALAGELSADRSRAAQASSSLAASEAALRNELVGAYVGGYFISPVAPVSLNGVGATDPAVSEGYISVATDTVRGVINRYQTDRIEWADAVTKVSASEKQSQEAVSAAATARAAALDEAASVTQQLTGLQDQLASLEAKAGAQQATSLQGGPVAGGLVAAVAAQIDQIAATPATVTSASPTSQGPPGGTGGVSAGAGTSTTTRSSAPSPPVAVPAATTLAPTTAPPATTSPPSTAPPAVTAPATSSPPSTAPPATPPSTAAAPARQAPNPPSFTAASPTTSVSSGPPTSADWLALRTCESGDTYTENTGNGYYGAYQFSQATWTGLGYPGRPDQEPPAMQDQAAAQLQAEAGWGAWPACSAALGL
ncbi:MAG: transglycosylase family protein [Acidimicrobiales bacterium]